MFSFWLLHIRVSLPTPAHRPIKSPAASASDDASLLALNARFASVLQPHACTPAARCCWNAAATTTRFGNGHLVVCVSIQSEALQLPAAAGEFRACAPACLDSCTPACLAGNHSASDTLTTENNTDHWARFSHVLSKKPARTCVESGEVGESAIRSPSKVSERGSPVVEMDVAEEMIDEDDMAAIESALEQVNVFPPPMSPLSTHSP